MVPGDLILLGMVAVPGRDGEISLAVDSLLSTFLGVNFGVSVLILQHLHGNK